MVPSATTSNRRGIRWQTHLGNEKGQSPVPATEQQGRAVRATFPIVVVGLLGACTYGPRFIIASPPSNTELGQDVPNDAKALPSPIIIQCADALHQNRPGGSDYTGPPVPMCPRIY
jgi:hypothetical protein